MKVDVHYTVAHAARRKQTQRGNEAIDMLVKFLEANYGQLTVSAHESKYSSGIHGQPDVVFQQYGIEVKRVEFFVKHRIPQTDECYTHLNNLSIDPASWRRLKTWCQNNRKIPIVIAVVTHGRQEPIFILFRREQIDLLATQRTSKWIQINSWKLFHQGALMNNGTMLE